MRTRIIHTVFAGLLCTNVCFSQENGEVEYLLRLNGLSWNATRVSSTGTTGRMVRVQVTPPLATVPLMTRLAVFRKNDLVGFVRVRSSYHGTLVVGPIGKSMDPSKIAAGDVLKRFDITQRKKQPAPELDKKEKRAIEKAVSRLGHSSYRIREEATQSLRSHGKEILPFIQDLVDSTDPEIRLRARELRAAIMNKERTVDAGLAKVLTRWKGGSKPLEERGFLGISMGDVDRGAKPGTLVLGIIEGSPADEIGLQRQDIVLSVDDEELLESLDLTEIVSSKDPGTKVKLKIKRGEEEMELEAVLGTRPEDPRMK